MNTLEFALLVPFVVLALFLIVRQFIYSNRKSPFSERLARFLLQLSAWLRCTGVACDAAILRYRCERRVPVPGLDSTAEREYHEHVAQERVV